MTGAPWGGVGPIQELRCLSQVNAGGDWVAQVVSSCLLQKLWLTPDTGQGKKGLIQPSVTVLAPDPQNSHLKPFTSTKDPLGTPPLPADSDDG